MMKANEWWYVWFRGNTFGVVVSCFEAYLAAQVMMYWDTAVSESPLWSDFVSPLDVGSGVVTVMFVSSYQGALLHYKIKMLTIHGRKMMNIDLWSVHLSWETHDLIEKKENQFVVSWSFAEARYCSIAQETCAYWLWSLTYLPSERLCQNPSGYNVRGDFPN